MVELVNAADQVELNFFLPGVAAENIDIQITKEAVTVSGDRPAPAQDKDKKVWSEFRYGRFSRTIKLPVAVVNSEAKADFSNGKLSLTLPKLVEKVNQPYRLSLGQDRQPVEQPALADQKEPEVNLTENSAPAEPTTEAEKTWAA
ncbi:heat shock protein Hsp20 [Thalassoporum mexicanum PCC 7367]|uniref:Hsp20/alpha crystallin family protein n=1 Tax=Thalassoporum mexicanum TaxID=3457544 RepID=UPI00029FE079|nr:Hsp20/alpha crystallin family protein [Pseudanabaena sp. PCC 7367]AFY71527.1 heat shock protein Hsp20 [Pseudanabaena sp. PCC 7367]